MPKGDKLERETLRSVDEMQRLVCAAAEEDAKHPKNHFGDLAVRLVVLLTTGLRNGELGALGWDDVMMRGGIPLLRVRFQVTRNWATRHPEWDRPRDPTKTNRVDEIPLHIDALKALKAQKLALQRATPCNQCGAEMGRECVLGCTGARGFWRHDGPIFPSRKGEWRRTPLTVRPAQVRALVRVAIPEADADNFVTHCTRHTFASFALVASGGDFRRAMQLTRHETVGVFQKYMHRIGRDLSNPLPEMGLTWANVLEAQPEAMQLEAIDAEGWTVGGVGEDGNDETCGANVAEIIDGRELKRELWKAERHAERRKSQNELDKRYRASNATDFDTAYASWTVAGRPGARPSQVTAAARAVYDRVRHSHERNGPESPRFKVPRDVRQWGALAKKILMREHEPPEKQVEKLRVLNPGVEKPRPGVEVAIPREWDAARTAMKAKWRLLGAWAKFLKDRDARSASEMPEVIERELSEGEDSEDESDEP